MSRLTQKPSVAPLNPWANIASGTANQMYGSSVPSGVPTTVGTGFNEPAAISYVGQKFETSDGRELALVANGGVVLAAGVLVQSAAQLTTAQKLAITVPTTYPATAGLYQIYVTNSSTVMSVNQFAGGYAHISAGTGIGQTFKVASHTAGTNAGAVVLTLEDPIQTTLDATSKVSLNYNPYGGVSASAAGAVSAGVIISPTTQTAGIIGVSLYGIAASTAPTYNSTSGALTAAGTIQYGLIVTHGPTSCLVDTVTLVGNAVGHSTAVAGAVAAATLTASAQIGTSLQTLTSAENGLIYLQL
jgi:hypothetical protein